MAGSSFGTLFKITTFGESHGPALGVVIDGCPAGLKLDMDFIQNELRRRRPGQSRLTTQRQEDDAAQFLSGVFEGQTTGAPIAAVIANSDARSKDYDHLQNAYRPSHADYTYEKKYGFRDHRGGGRSSARETATRVLAGAIAKLLLKNAGVEVTAYVSQVGPVELDTALEDLDLTQIEATPVRCPDPVVAKKMMELIDDTRKAGDTVGGVVSCVIKGCPVGLGEPVFDRLNADLGKAMLSINACRAFEIGAGFAATHMLGSQHNDVFVASEGDLKTKTNHSGGIQGGISNGMDIFFRAAFKPVATLLQEQDSVNRDGESVKVKGRGRHDPCVLPRAVPIVEAMAALVLADHWLRQKTSTLL